MSTIEHEPATGLRFGAKADIPTETLLQEIEAWDERTLRSLLTSGDGTGLISAPAETLHDSIKAALEGKGIRFTVGANVKGPVLEIRGTITGTLAYKAVRHWAGQNGFTGGTEDRIGTGA